MFGPTRSRQSERKRSTRLAKTGVRILPRGYESKHDIGNYPVADQEPSVDDANPAEIGIPLETLLNLKAKAERVEHWRKKREFYWSIYKELSSNHRGYRDSGHDNVSPVKTLALAMPVYVFSAIHSVRTLATAPSRRQDIRHLTEDAATAGITHEGNGYGLAAKVLQIVEVQLVEVTDQSVEIPAISQTEPLQTPVD